MGIRVAELEDILSSSTNAVTVIVPSDKLAKVMSPADAPPIVTPSIVPPLISAVVSTDDGTVITPVELAIVAAAVPSLALILVTSILVVSL